MPSLLRLLLVFCLLAPAAPLSAQPEGFVDLIVRANSYRKGNIYQGDSLPITGTETNRGTLFAAPSFKIAFGLTPNAIVPDSDDVRLGETVEDEGLDPGEAFTGTVTMVVPFTVPPGNYHLGAYINADDLGPFEESSYDNNDWVSAAADIEIVEAKLSIASPVREVAPGANTTFTAVPNGSPHRPTYRWERRAARTDSFTPLDSSATYSGVNSPSLTVKNITRAMDGDAFRCVVSVEGFYETTSLASATASLVVGKKKQTINFPGLSTRTFGDPAVPLLATASSQLPVTYVLVSGPGSLSGNSIELLEPGVITVRATQPGDDDYAPAPPVERTFTVTKRRQTIDFAELGTLPFTDDPIPLTATATSGLPVEFTLLSGPGTLSGSSLQLLGAGTFSIEASQPGDTRYEAAPKVVRRLVVTTAGITASFSPLVQTYNGLPRLLGYSTSVRAPVYLSYGINRSAPINVGNYQVSLFFVHGNARIATATLNVLRAPLRVSSLDRLRPVGVANPPLLLAYSGFVNGETAAVLDRRPVASTRAVKTSLPGEYPITVAGGADNNYAFSYSPGTLTVRGFGGIYEALVYDPSRTGTGGERLSVGKVTLTVPANSLAYTGTLALASEAALIPLKGKLDTTAPHFVASDTWSRPAVASKSQSAISLALTIETNPAAFFIDALAVSGIALADLDEGVRLPDRLAYAGPSAFTLIFHEPELAFPSAPSAARPRGAGHAAATLSPASLLSFSGRLGDGTPVTATAPSDADRNHRIFARTQRARTDSQLSGTLRLRPDADTRLRVADDLLVWQKGPGPADKSYREGFGPLAMPATLDPWIAPTTTVTLPQLLGLAEDGNAPGTFALSYLPEFLDLGTSGTTLPSAVTLTRTSALTVPLPNPRAFKFTSFNAKTGAFAGSFSLSDPSSTSPKPVLRSVTFSGVLRQPPASEIDPVLGAGHFLVPDLLSKTAEQPSAALSLSKQ